MAFIQQQQISPQQQIPQEQEQQQWQPSFDAEKTRALIKDYGTYPTKYKEQDLEEIRMHAGYHNVPFYEGDFSILDAIKQAGGGFIEGFTTLRVADHPDNAYEAVARNIGHLVGFVPGILSGPLKALGIMSQSKMLLHASKAVVGIKSGPMLAADLVTKRAKRIIKPILKGARGSRFGAADAASKMFLADKAKHIAEGAFHLGVASSVSSIWDGVDQMMHSFVHGAGAGAGFRVIGNIIPGTVKGDKFIKGLAGSMFMGIPSTLRGATTPEQVYEYLAGAYFGSKELTWKTAKAGKALKKFEEAMKTDPKLDAEKQIQDWDKYDTYSKPVREEIDKMAFQKFRDRDYNSAEAYELMKAKGITDQIPAEQLPTEGYKMLNAVRQGVQKQTKYKSREDLGVALSGGTEGAQRLWSLGLNKAGMATAHFMPETFSHRKTIADFNSKLRKGFVKGVDVRVSDRQLMEAGGAVDEANRTLRRGDINSYKPWTLESIQSSYFQIKGAKGVFAIAPLEKGKRTVEGATGWPVQMAIDKGIQKVFVYNPPEKKWFKWNPAVDRFKAIDYTPKLTKNPAVLGSYKIKGGSPAAQAIKDVIEKTFRTLKKPLKETDLSKKDDRDKHSRTLQNIRDMHSQISEKRNLLADVRSDLRDASLGKVRMKELAAQEKTLNSDIDKLYKDIHTKHNVLESTQYIDMTSGLIINDIDTGSKAQDFTLMKKGEYFANNHLEEIWNVDNGSQNKRNSMLDSAKIVDSIMRKYTIKDDKNVNIDIPVKVLERLLSTKNKPFTLSPEGRLEMRKWMRTLNLGRQVIHVKTSGSDKEVLSFTNPERPTSLSGKTVIQIESPKVIEEVYKDAGGKLETGSSPSSLVLLDQITRKSKRGFTVDVALNKLANHLQFNELNSEGKKYTEKEAISAKNNVVGNIIREVYKKDNLYPFGGQGDKGRIVFVKLHPELKNTTPLKQKLLYRTLVKTIKNNIKKNKIDKNALKLLNNDKSIMKDKFGVKEKDFEKMVVSNLMYDLSLNGYKINPGNITKIMKGDFIGSAVAFNKRHQIWMTDGYSGSKDYVSNAVNESGKKILDDLSPNNNLIYRLIDDPILPKDLKDKVLKAMSSQLGEDVDGAILSRDDVVNVLNKDAGHPESGQQKSFIVDNTPLNMADGSKKNMGALLGKYMIHNVGTEASRMMKEKGIHFLIYKSAAKQTGERLIGKYDVGGISLPNIPIVYKKNMPSSVGSDILTAARTNYKTREIFLDKDLMKQKFKEKAWTKPKMKGVDPLPEYAFKTYEQWEEFVIKHEKAHFTKENQAIPKGAARENHANQLALFKDKGLILTGGESYELNPESIKYSTSVVQDPHMAQKQIWVKQLFTNLHEYSDTPIPKSVIEDINQSVLKESFMGEKLFNNVLTEYQHTFNPEKIEFLVNNLEKLSTTELIKTLKAPGAERFAEVALQKMLRIVESDIESSFQDGEITAQQRAEQIQKFTESVSPMDRLLKNSAIVGEKANLAGETGYPAYMHKFVRDYRQAVLHSYFVKSVTRPKMDNSLLARMRPYDKWMQKDFKELDTNDSIFYLDNAYKKTIIKLENGKETTLGELWKNHSKDPKFLKHFNALILRVPMDSISGAHKLQFKGFTNREGHGVMLNSKTMRALGGADLDGDEAFVYFGGRNESGKGYGMKESWMNAIHANKGEYYNKKGDNVGDNKNAVIQHGPYKGKTFKEILTVASEGNPLKESRALYYSPLSRMETSEKAVSGRDMLGRVITHAQIMKSAFSSLMEATNKNDIFVVNKGYGKKKKKYRVTVTPNFGKEDLAYQRELARAQTAFTSDPMDEAGLREYDHYFKTLHDAYFTTTFEAYNPKTKQFKPMAEKEIPKDWNIGDYYGGKGDYDKPSLLGSFKNMNTAYFGYNHRESRNYTMDEVNHLASDIGNLNENQKNTILPKMVDTLEGLDWSDNLFRRVDRKGLENAYEEINALVENKEGKFGPWLQNAMNRTSFAVIYNEHIKSVLVNDLHDPIVRKRIALKDDPRSLKEFINIVKHSIWGKEFLGYEGKEARMNKLYNYKERISILEQMTRQAEDFLSNDVATMATIKEVDRILKTKRVDTTTLKRLSNAVAKFKARSYLSKQELKSLDFKILAETAKEKGHAELTEYLLEKQAEWHKGEEAKIKQQDLIGDKRSAAWDQMQLDKKIRKFKDGLKNDTERELFDHLFIGTLDRGDMGKINKIIQSMPQQKNSPIFRDLMAKLIKETTRTTQSRLAINSQEISDIAIQNHLQSMNKVFVKMWTPLDKKTTEATVLGVENVLNKSGMIEEDILNDLVIGAHKGQGYAGIKKGKIDAEDKAVVTEIASILKRYNKKVEGALPHFNEQIRGITGKIDPEGQGKDLNALNRQDFILIRNYLRELEGGTLMQKMRKSDTPELMKRYYALFPSTVNRELMAYDIQWLRKKSWYVDKYGEAKEGYVSKPTYALEQLMKQAYNANSLATGKAETLFKDIQQQFIHLEELGEDGVGLFHIANAQRELSIKESIDNRKNSDLPDDMKTHYKLNYDTSRQAVEKEYNWKKMKDKTYTVLNNDGKRVRATGFEIVNGLPEKNLVGLKKAQAERFKSLWPLIAGDGKSIQRYKTGLYFDPETKLQPRYNWSLFVKDMEKSFNVGEDIPINLGIDGMRHIMRSMMYDLAETAKAKKDYANWIIKYTEPMDFDAYWPHMFFDKKAAEINIKKTLDFIRKNPSLNDKQKKSRIQSLILRQKTITGDWEFQDMQDFDKVDVLEINEAISDIAAKKRKTLETVKWTDMNSTFGSMMSREGHIGGWSLDIGSMNAYVKNITSTYFKQMNQIMSRKTIHDAKKRMTKKFGKELAGNWEKYFKLYVQGAMGQPDVIPKAWYDDPNMKLKGTPYSAFADNHILERVNKIRKALGIKKSDLPQELQDYTFQDLKNWSNMEAKFELATLLAHPKSAVTNIFGGSLHTIQSAGHKAFIKARSLSFLKRINPKWNSMQDVEDFVVSKGVVPEFMIHELGLGQTAANRKSIESFIGELSSKINSKDVIERKEIRSLGKKYKLSDRIMNTASKFMSIPERALRRDAFMAHYIRAWERFGGTITDPNHPFLIEMGKKGVKATQFLYEAPQRPFFARTALGKVMARFQLYAWNSVRFRNDVIREAKIHGFKEGTTAFNKFKRTMTIDLFVLALGNMFLYSLFDNALPQPLSWFQDTADWLFGNEKDRERAFFGAYPTAIAPLQMITPPIARFPITGLMEWARDDYTKFSEYQVYTALPFGRLIRDVAQPGKGLIENPSRFLEKMAGMPIRDLQRYATERKKAIEEGTRYKQPKIGF